MASRSRAKIITPIDHKVGTQFLFGKIRDLAEALWQEGRAPIARFVTDDHKVIGVMSGHITRTFEERVSQYRMVSSPTGVIVIRGPGGQRLP